MKIINIDVTVTDLHEKALQIYSASAEEIILASAQAALDNLVNTQRGFLIQQQESTLSELKRLSPLVSNALMTQKAKAEADKVKIDTDFLFLAKTTLDTEKQKVK